MASRVAAEAADRVSDFLSALPEVVQADVRVTGYRWGTMRFANGRIHQPHLEEGVLVSLRVCENQRIATATVDGLSKDSLEQVFREARSLASVAPIERKFPGFPPDGSRASPAVEYSERTASLGPDEQVQLAERALEGARDVRPESRIAGAVNVGSEWLAVANTKGLARTTRRTIAQTSVLVEDVTADPPVSGWSEGADWDARRLNTERVGREAGQRVARSTPESAEPGNYRVLLDGPAVSELIGQLGYLGFGGHAEEEGWSCLKRKRGKRIAPEAVTLVDDGRSPQSLPQGVDLEGTPKRRTLLVDHGIADGPVTDLVTAGRLDRKRTGHALSPESPIGDWGPIPTQMLLRSGDARFEELVKETRRGILVTRFHYVRVVHPGKSIITGMTRDGTYRIANGELAAPVRNLRFTESVLRALAGAQLLGREARCYSDERGFVSVTCPPLLTNAFRFTSATLF